MKFKPRVLLTYALATVAAGVLILAVASLTCRAVDYTDRLLAGRSAIVSARESWLADSAGYRETAFTLTDQLGRLTRGNLRIPLGGNGPLPAVLILAGQHTGARATRLISLEKPAVLCAMDYPSYPMKRISPARLPVTLHSLRAAAFDAAGMAFNVLDYLCGRPDVDPDRITVLGASFGVPFAVIAALDNRVSGVVLIYGAGDLEELIDWNLRRKVRFAPLRKLASHILGTLVSPFEPTAYIDRIAPRPLLMINSSRDEKVPERCVRLLFNKASAPRELVWLDTEHIHPSNRSLIDSLTRISSDWLVRKNLL